MDVIQDIEASVDCWLTSLDNYSMEELLMKPSVDDWSLGQVYMHLLADTGFYIEQVNECLYSPAHHREEALEMAREMFQNNSFPDRILQGDPANALMPQPANKETLKSELIGIRNKLIALSHQVQAVRNAGKTKHPGFGYFSAPEWLQFATMHFRHHLRQKQRIDSFLAIYRQQQLASNSQ